jgi:hypothetical protein
MERATAALELMISNNWLIWLPPSAGFPPIAADLYRLRLPF